MSLTLLIFVLPLAAAADEGLPAQGSATAGTGGSSSHCCRGRLLRQNRDDTDKNRDHTTKEVAGGGSVKRTPIHATTRNRCQNGV
jgi:hypothetical protein